MSLEKARAALEAARDLDIDGASPDKNGLPPIQLADQWTRLLTIARTQAAIAEAEASERAADALESLVRIQSHTACCNRERTPK